MTEEQLALHLKKDLKNGLCERGNIYLMHTEENYHNAWFRVGDDHYIQLSIRPRNYPAIDLSLIKISEEKLAEHIRKEFGGGSWYAMKLNIKGVETDSHGVVIGDDDEQED